MSRLPYTSLVVNHRGVDTIGKAADVVYLIAPALRGGEKMSQDGVPVRDDVGNAVYAASDIITSLRDFEEEFGRAVDGSDASKYAKWLYDYGKFAIRCRRVYSSDLSYASAYLKDGFGADVVRVQSLTQDHYANRIMVDVDPSTNYESQIQYQQVHYGNDGTLTTDITYALADFVTFAGTRLGDSLRFRWSFYGNGQRTQFKLFGFRANQGTAPCVVKDGDRVLIYAGDDVDESSLTDGQFSYHFATKTVYFGSPLTRGAFNVHVNLEADYGSVILAVSGDGASKSLSLDFPADGVSFDAFYVNGIGDKHDQKFNRLMRLANIPGIANPSGLSFEVRATNEQGKVELVVYAAGGVVERYTGKSIQELGLSVNASSGLVMVEWAGTGEDAVPIMPITSFYHTGVNVTVYNGQFSETFDDIRDADELADVTSAFVTFTPVGANGALTPASVVGISLSGGSAGLNPTIADYLEAVVEAESQKDVTVVLAPGVEDKVFHYILKDHCERMSALGNYRVTLVGCGLDESLAQKISRTSLLYSERVCVVGDGLLMVDPYYGRKRLVPGSQAVCAVAGLLLSLPYYVSLTRQTLRNAYGTEHKYTTAEHDYLHDSGRLITFKNDGGVQIYDGITTSAKNAMEDLHMVRVYDVISRGVRKASIEAIGNSNMPVTWARVIGLIQKLLDGLKKLQAIQDFKILNEVRLQDIVDRRCRLRIGVIPVFPVKYVEGVVDIVPPMSVEI